MPIMRPADRDLPGLYSEFRESYMAPRSFFRFIPTQEPISNNFSEPASLRPDLPLLSIESIYADRTENMSRSVEFHELDTVQDIKRNFSQWLGSSFGSSEIDDPLNHLRPKIAHERSHRAFSSTNTWQKTSSCEVEVAIPHSNLIHATSDDRKNEDFGNIDKRFGQLSYGLYHGTYENYRIAIPGEMSRLSYRQQTSELIQKIDKLLNFRGTRCGIKGKRSSRKIPAFDKDKVKPRARNIVLKEVTELIRRMNRDEQVDTLEILISCTDFKNSS
jgi:hypothetical protein